LLDVLEMEKTSADSSIPGYVKLSFLMGGVSFLAAMLYPVFITKEYPPEYSLRIKPPKKNRATS